jgi:N-acetylmuramic acid 6-phosphate etherase
MMKIIHTITVRHMQRITESDSLYRHLEQKSVREIIQDINREDAGVALALQKELDSIEKLIDAVVERMKEGGRLFYIGAGTSGRLGILDASECPPTFGVPHEWVIGIIAGGDSAIRKAVEFAEDDTNQAWKDLSAYGINTGDLVVGIAASGTTPYVIGGLKDCQSFGIATGCITCNPGAPVLAVSDFPVCVQVGPEYVTGSTRMKSGTAQKMVLNMISTTTMIQLGRVRDNKMVDMQLSNQKLIERGSLIIANALSIDLTKAKELLLKYGSVRAALEKNEK